MSMIPQKIHLTIISIVTCLTLFLASCGPSPEEEFKESCPYDLVYPGHFFKIPVTLTPHQPEYSIGDTLTISTTMSDSIYDISTQRNYKIENWPFKPLSILYRIDTDDSIHYSGYIENELLIDNIYEPSYTSGIGRYAAGFNTQTTYDENDGQYRFEAKVVFKKPGRYIFLLTDRYQSNVASGNEEANAEADAVTIEGLCPTLGKGLVHIVESGYDHLNEYNEELVYLDENVYYGDLAFAFGRPKGDLGFGKIAINGNGFYGFEVVE